MALFSVIVMLPCFSASAQLALQQRAIEDYLDTKDAVVAIAVHGQKSSDSLFIQADKRLPMQSVFKFHIAIAMLAAVDQGKFELQQPIVIKKEVLLPDTWSPLRDRYPKGTTLPLSEIMTYMVSQSDNIACDVLLGLLGGPSAVDRYFKQQGIHDLVIQVTEEDMHADWNNQFLNWTTARSCNEVLSKYFYNREQELSPASHRFLWTIMKATETGAKRLKGDLPSAVVVAHKTGYSGLKEGVAEAVHDIGIVFPTADKPFFISVLISHSKESLAANEQIIAHVAKICYDYFQAIDE